MKYPEKYVDMDEAQRKVQKRTGFTWQWINQFVPDNIKDALYEFAKDSIELENSKGSYEI